MKLKIISLMLCMAACCVCNAEIPVVKGTTWPDTEGKHINCHGGCIIKGDDGTYYWYGENRELNAPQKGVACYTSTDLVNWQNRGIVMQVSDKPGAIVEKGSTIERPKVIYNPKTGKYVMWFHHELKGKGYSAAQAACAVADNPLGPFIPIKSGRVNPGKLPMNLDASQKPSADKLKMEWWTPEWRAEIEKGLFTFRDLEGGQMSRDMTLFVDDDGTAYHIYSSEDNLTLQIAELDESFTSHTGKYIRIFPGGHNEAPALFKKDGKYWMITSGCTGWAPNEARMMWADSLLGEWHQVDNPCRGEGSDKTFGGQGTYILTVGNDITFMADMWNPKNLPDSRHLWLPITFDNDGAPIIKNAAPSEKDMSAYLMVYFSDNDHSLHMAISDDGYSFTALNNNKPVISGDTIAEQHGIRDPHIFRGPDNSFYLALTDLHLFAKREGLRDTEWERPSEYGWGNNRSLVLMKSKDLINWSHNVVRLDKLFPEEYSEIGCAWAPETTYDPVRKKPMVYFTLRKRGENLDGGNPSEKKTRLFYAYTDNDFTTLISEPQPLFEYPDPSIQILDADICPMPDGRFFMTYCAQENPGGIKAAVSDNINSGYAYDGNWIDSEPGACEAPTTWKRIGEDKWVVMYDIFSINPHNFGFVETSDFKTFTPLGHFNEGPMITTNFTSPKHGAVIQITAEEAQRLRNHWPCNPDFVQYEEWKDSNGNPINAHGGGMLYHDGKYYWYGEYKKGETILPEWATWECYRTDVSGVSCYSSSDLKKWTFEGLVLKADPENPDSDLHPSKVIERPKVIYNRKTGKFVMWVHAESADYSKAAAGVAVSDSPTGPFSYLGSFRPNDAMSRDQTLFVDDDGKAYQLYSSENNETLYISELTDDYLKPSGKFTRNFIGKSREAPAVFKRNGKYYLITSGCTGWDPNQAELAVADNILGPWTVIGNPCTGMDSDKTFYAQSTFVLPVQGKKDAFIAMFDRWDKTDLQNSRYVWLPIVFDGDKVSIPWRKSWDTNILR